MIHDVDAELIVDLAFQPVRRRPQRRHRLDGILLADPHLDAQAMTKPRRVQAVDHVEPLLARRPVGGGHVRAVVERRSRVVLQEPHDVEQAIRGDDDRPVSDPERNLLHRARDAVPDGGHHSRRLRAFRRSLILGRLWRFGRRLRLGLWPRPGRNGGLGGGGFPGSARVGCLRGRLLHVILGPGGSLRRPVGAAPSRLRFGFVRHEPGSSSCPQAQSSAPLRHA